MGKCSYLIVFSFSLILITSYCQQNAGKNQQGKLISINIDSVISDSTVYFSQIFSDFQIIPLELTKESVIGIIINVKFVNDTIYVFDGGTKAVFLFSKQGKYLNKICRIGKGPGEYLNPVNFDILGNRIVIYDWAARKLNFYHKDGNYLNSLNIKNRFTSFTCRKEGFYFFIPRPENLKDLYADLFYEYNTRGDVVSKLFKFKDYGNGLNYNISTRTGNFFKAGNEIRFFMPFCDTIFSINGKHLIPFISLRTTKYKLTKGEIMEIRDKSPSFLPAELNGLNKIYSIYNYGEFAGTAFFKFDISKKQYWTFCNLKTGDALCSSRRVDDLTLMNLDVFMVNDHQFAGIINQVLFSRLKSTVASAKSKLSEEQKSMILRLSESDNPVIIIYNVKEIRN